MYKKTKLILLSALVLVMLLCTAVSVFAATYKYDDLNRLVEVTYDSGLKIEYTYDAGGNILGVKAVKPVKLEPIGDKTVNEDELLQFTVSATAPQGTELTYTVSNLPEGAAFDSVSGVFSWEPTFEQAGIYNDIKFKAAAGKIVVSEDITITVNNINQAPVLNPVGDKTVNEGEPLQFTIFATDEDNDALTFSAVNIPAGASFNADTATFSWIPSYEQAGSYTEVLFEVNDGADTISESITITVNDINTKPGDNIEVADSETGTTVIFEHTNKGGNTTVTAYDSLPEGTYYDVNFLPGYFDIDTDAEFTGKVKIRISYDIEGLALPEESLRLYQFKNGELIDITSPVDPGPGGNPDTTTHIIEGEVEHFCYFGVGVQNRAPVANAGADQVVECTSSTGAAVTLDASGSYDMDAELAGLTPPNVQSDGRSIVSYTWSGPFGEVSGLNPTVALPYGTWTISLTVSDGLLEATGTVVVDVVDTTPPVLTVPQDVTLVATGILTPVTLETASATDLVDGEIEVTNDGLQQYPKGITLVKYTATDSHGNTAHAILTVTVLNAEPVLALIGSKTVKEGKLLEFVITASDPDGDGLSYAAGNLPEGAVFDALTGKFTWTPWYTQSGTYIVHFEATDGTVIDNEDIDIVVENVTESELINELTITIVDMGLDKNMEHKLISDANKAKDFIDKGNENQAIMFMEKFISEINKGLEKKDITQEHADKLINAAETIRSVIGL